MNPNYIEKKPCQHSSGYVKTGQVDPRLGNQGRQPGDEVEGFDKFVRSEFEQPQAGPKGGGQDARSQMTCVVPSR